MKELCWKANIADYKNKDFIIYLFVETSDDYDIREVKKDLEDFKEWLLAKYKQKEEKEGFLKYLNKKYELLRSKNS